MDEATVFSGPFLFVSYSHRDAQMVREDVSQLMDMGVRVWIDHRNEKEENMSFGDDWTKKASAAIAHPNCRGAIFYISAYALASRAIQREQNLIRQRSQQGNFSYYAVNTVAGCKMAKHFSQATSMCCEEGSPWYNEDYDTGDDDIRTMQRSMFNNNILYIERESSAQCVQAIFDKIAMPLGAVDNEGALISSLAQSKLASRDTGEIVFGIYKGQRSEPVARSTENARFTVGRQDYIHHNNEFFVGRPLKWKLLYVHDGVAVLLCSEVVEKCSAVNAPALLQAFRQLAFNEAENALVQSIRLLTQKDIDKIAPGEQKQILKLDETQADIYWWIDEKGILDEWKLAYKNNQLSSNGFLVTRIKGLRPVIEIKATQLQEIKGE